MQLQKFANTHRLKTQRDECGDMIINGKHGHIFQSDEKYLGLIYMPAPHGDHEPSVKSWINRKRQLVAAACRITQDGDAEGTAIFDPTNREQAAVAVRVAGCKRRRLVTPDQAESLRSRLAGCRRGV